MSEREKRNLLNPDIISGKEIEMECSNLRDVLESFRNFHYAAADQSVFYWKSRHDAILNKIRTPMPFSKFRHPLLWVPAAAALLFCLIFCLPERRTPVPDIAAGYDQDLLMEVERALSRNCPAALEPVDILAREIER